MKTIISNFICRCCAPFSPSVVVHHPVRRFPVQLQKLDEVTGRITTSTEYKTHNVAEALNKYSVNDFSLDNLLAINAPLNPVTLSPSKHSILDTVENIVKSQINE